MSASLQAAICSACETGDIFQVERLIEQGASATAFAGEREDSPLHHAARRGQRGICIRLVAVHRAATQATNSRQKTPADVADAAGYPDMKPLLVQMPFEVYAAGMKLQATKLLFPLLGDDAAQNRSISLSPPSSPSSGRAAGPRIGIRSRAISSPEKPLFGAVEQEFVASQSPPLQAELPLVMGSLRRLNMFDQCSEADLHVFARMFERKVLPADTLLAEQGRRPTAVFVLTAGQVLASHAEIKADGTKGIPKQLCTLGPGSVMCDMPLLFGCSCVCTFRTKTDAVISRLPVAAFQAILQRACQTPSAPANGAADDESISATGASPKASSSPSSTSPRRGTLRKMRKSIMGKFKKNRKDHSVGSEDADFSQTSQVSSYSTSEVSQSPRSRRHFLNRSRSRSRADSRVVRRRAVSDGSARPMTVDSSSHFKLSGPDCVLKVRLDTGNMLITAASVDKLVTFLFASNQSDVFYATDFFLTFREFTASEVLLTQLSKAYFESNNASYQDAVIRILCLWTRRIPYAIDPQLASDLPSIEGIKSLARKIGPTTRSPVFTKLQKNLDDLERGRVKSTKAERNRATSDPQSAFGSHRIVVHITTPSGARDTHRFEVTNPSTTLKDIANKVCHVLTERDGKRESPLASDESATLRAKAFLDPEAYRFRAYGMFSRLEPDTSVIEHNVRSVFMVPRREYNVSQDVADALSPEFVAHHLTLLDFDTFRRIEANELTNSCWRKHPEKAPHVNEMVTRFNAVCNWAVQLILNERTPEKRASVISKLVEIGNLFYQLGNYHGLTQIQAALRNQSISRLKESWKLVSSETRSAYEVLFNKIISPENNRQVYREKLRQIERRAEQDELDAFYNTQVVRPTLPYLGLFTQDMLFCEDGNPATISRGRALNKPESAWEADDAMELVNFLRYRGIARIVSDLRAYQQTPYTKEDLPRALEQSLEFTRWLFGKFKLLSEDDMWNRSQELERHGASIMQEPAAVVPELVSRVAWKSVGDSSREVADIVEASITRTNVPNMTAIIASTTQGQILSNKPIVCFAGSARHSGLSTQPRKMLIGAKRLQQVYCEGSGTHITFTDVTTRDVVLRPSLDQIDFYRYEPNLSLLYLITETGAGCYCHVFKAEGLSGDDAFLIIHRELQRWSRRVEKSSEAARQEAIAILKDPSNPAPNGAFVLRDSQSRPGSYALSMIFRGRIHHILILRTADGVYFKDSPLVFRTLHDLILYHCVHPAGLPCKLTPEGSLFLTDDCVPIASNEVPDAMHLPLPLSMDSQDSSTWFWFHGPISREDSEDLLAARGMEDGTFLVRSKTGQSDTFVISFVSKARPCHVLVERTEDGQYVLDGTIPGGSSVPQVIRLCGDPSQTALPTTLTTPIARQIDQVTAPADLSAEAAAEPSSQAAAAAQDEHEKTDQPEATNGHGPSTAAGGKETDSESLDQASKAKRQYLRLDQVQTLVEAERDVESQHKSASNRRTSTIV